MARGQRGTGVALGPVGGWMSLTVPTEKVFFGDAVAGLYLRGLGEQVTSELRDGLRELGIDLSRPLLPAYPAATFAAGIDRVAQLLFANVARDEAHYRIGHITVRGFVQGAVGEAMFEHLKVLTPERSVQRMARNLRGAMNFIEVGWRPAGPASFELDLNNVVGMPGFFRGLVEGGSMAAGRSHPSVTVVRHEPPGATLLFKPSPA
jgi:uncharacterized protein (TIGR02265 family)